MGKGIKVLNEEGEVPGSNLPQPWKVQGDVGPVSPSQPRRCDGVVVKVPVVRENMREHFVHHHELLNESRDMHRTTI